MTGTQQNREGNLRVSAGREMSSVIALADVRGTKDAIAQLTSSARQRAREAAANNKPLAEQYYLGQVHAYELAARLISETPGYSNPGGVK
jgi:plasmid stabilization system protein ParE